MSKAFKLAVFGAVLGIIVVVLEKMNIINEIKMALVLFISAMLVIPAYLKCGKSANKKSEGTLEE